MYETKTKKKVNNQQSLKNAATLQARHLAWAGCQSSATELWQADNLGSMPLSHVHLVATVNMCH